MPVYNSFALPPSVYPGDTYVAINAEQPATGVASQQVALGDKDGQTEKGVSVEVTFAAAPGAFEVDVQVADTDLTGSYVTVGQLTQADLNATFTCRKEVGTYAKFARLLTKQANANAVNCTGKISFT